MKRSIFVLGLILLAALMVTACVAPAPAPAEAPVEAPAEEPAAEEPAAEEMEEEPAEAVMLEFYHDKSGWTDNIDIMGQSAAEANGVGFVTIPSEDTTNYQATVRAALTTDAAPDLFTYWSGFRMEDIVAAGAAADVTEVWQPYLDSGEYSQGLANAFAFDGTVYALPFHFGYWNIYYNKPLFEELGLEVPTTWEEFEALNATLVENGVAPLAQTFIDRWQAFIIFEEMVLRTHGPEFYSKLMFGEAKYTDPEVVEAMELWKEMMDNGYLTNDYAFGTGTDTFLPAFQAGDVAMVAIGDWYASSLTSADLEPGVDFDAFIMPNRNPDLPAAVFFEAGPLLIGENSPNKADAMKVADWWMSVEAQDEWNGLMGFMPANNKAASPSVVAEGVQSWINDNSAELVLRYWEATPPDIVETAVDEFARFMVNPDQYMLVLENIQAKADQVWAERE
ncbi:MAG: extracellular solute-binding protein [Chloroflexi bacterium]|nr:extracellular solute-binding protein [Chloroflexota bacterium]